MHLKSDKMTKQKGETGVGFIVGGVLGAIIILMILAGVVIFRTTIPPPNSICFYHDCSGVNIFPIYTTVNVQTTMSVNSGVLIVNYTATQLKLNATKMAFSEAIADYYFSKCTITSAIIISQNGSESIPNTTFVDGELTTHNFFQSNNICVYDVESNSQKLLSSTS